MRRKVIQLARKTLVVSLPRKWVKKFSVMKGDEVQLDENFEKIVVSVAPKEDFRKIRLKISSKNERIIRWEISALHKSGFDEIEIEYEDSNISKILQELVKDLFIGFAITEQSKERMVLRCIARDIKEEFNNSFRRAFLVTLSMGEGITEYSKRSSSIGELLSLEKTNNQLTNFCERILVKYGYEDSKKTCFAYVIVWNLEKVCDSYKYIIEAILESKLNGFSQIFMNSLNDLNNILRGYYELYFGFNKEKLESLSIKSSEFQKKCTVSLSKTEGQDAIFISRILQASIMISDFSASIIALNC